MAATFDTYSQAFTESYGSPIAFEPRIRSWRVHAIHEPQETVFNAGFGFAIAAIDELQREGIYSFEFSTGLGDDELTLRIEYNSYTGMYDIHVKAYYEENLPLYGLREENEDGMIEIIFSEIRSSADAREILLKLYRHWLEVAQLHQLRSFTLNLEQ